MVRTSEVFTPAKLPTITSVDRTAVTEALGRVLPRGGNFVSVLGTTKLGKTTLVRKSLDAVDLSIYVPGQTLQAGPADLWQKCASELGIPTSVEASISSTDVSTWGLLGQVTAKIPGLAAKVGSTIGGQHGKTSSSGTKIQIDPERAVTASLTTVEASGVHVVVAIDDFHFISDQKTRKDILLALRPLADQGCTVVLISTPPSADDPAFSGTNLGGRRKTVKVPRWSETDLARIATVGFAALNVTANPLIVERLARESFGSPQIMQELCLNLCEDVNGVREEQVLRIALQEPSSWEDFFRLLYDDDAAAWLRTLGFGMTARRPRKKKRLPGQDIEIDGYQAILLALRDLNEPSVAFSKVKQKVGTMLELDTKALNKMNLELKAQNMDILASRDMKNALEAARGDALDLVAGEAEEDEPEFTAEAIRLAQEIPQPVFAATGERKLFKIEILDPLLSYTLRWHSEVFLSDR